MSSQHRQGDLVFVRQDIWQEHGPIILDPGLRLVVRKPECSPEAIKTAADR